MKQHYHLIGVGGIGMSGLARILLSQGAEVSGSDQAASPRLDELAAMGARVYVGHAAEHAPATGTVVVSDAIHEGNPELDECRKRGLRIIRRSQLLGEMMNAGKGIAISGTHGKTSTTAMVAHILLSAGLDPTVVVGGDALGADRNAHAGKGDWFVAEACEAYGSFLHLAPQVAIVTNMEADHLDHHGDFAHIRNAFREFASRILPGGVLIANADDAEASALPVPDGIRTVLYGLQNGMWRATDIRHNGVGSTFTVLLEGQPVASASLHVPGDHNVSNALAAIVAAREAGVSLAAAVEALRSFRGVGRRFEPLGTAHGVQVFDDYAHHPTEIRATLAAAREAFPQCRVVAVFQPHLYSRTRDFLSDFIASFDDAGAVVITGIYKAREEPIPGVSAQAIVEGIQRRSPGKLVVYMEDKSGIPQWLRANARNGDTVFVMGAGDIREAGEAFVRETAG